MKRPAFVEIGKLSGSLVTRTGMPRLVLQLLV
jgi:hypothetical protein